MQEPTTTLQTGDKARLWTRNFVLVCLLNFLNFAGMWMLPSMLPVFIYSLGAADYMLGWIAGLTAIATIITRPLAGLAVARFGRRGIFMAGTAGMVLTCVAFAFVPLLGAVFAVRFVQGLAWGFTNTACTTIASDTIAPPRYAEGMGYFGLASSVAMTMTPALSLTLFYTWGGTAAALVCAGFFVLSLVCSCFVKTVRVPARTPESGTPKPQPQQHKRTPGAFIASTLLERAALSAGLLMMLTACSYGIVQSFIPALMAERGLEGASAFFVVMAIAALVARPTFGRWADKRSYLEPALCSFAAMTVSMLLMLLAHHYVSLFAAAVLQGVGYSAGFSLFLALATRDAHKERRGSAIATVMVGFDLGAGLSAVVLGFLVVWGGYGVVFAGGAVLSCAGFVLTLVFRQRMSARA